MILFELLVCAWHWLNKNEYNRPCLPGASTISGRCERANKGVVGGPCTLGLWGTVLPHTFCHLVSCFVPGSVWQGRWAGGRHSDGHDGKHEALYCLALFFCLLLPSYFFFNIKIGLGLNEAIVCTYFMMIYRISGWP